MRIEIRDIIMPPSSGGEPQVNEEYLEYLYNTFNVACWPINKIYLKENPIDYVSYEHIIYASLYVDTNTKFIMLPLSGNADMFTITVTEADGNRDYTEWFNCDVVHFYPDSEELLIAIQRNTNMSELDGFNTHGQLIDIHIDYSIPK